MKTGFISGEETTGDWPVVWSMIFIQTTLICCSLPTPLHFSYSSYSFLLFLQWNSIQHIHPAFPTSIWMSEYMMSDCQSVARLNAGCRIAWGQLAGYYGGGWYQWRQNEILSWSLSIWGCHHNQINVMDYASKRNFLVVMNWADCSQVKHVMWHFLFSFTYKSKNIGYCKLFNDLFFLLIITMRRITMTVEHKC